MYELSVIPGPPQRTEETYSSAVGRARDLAERQEVDVWYSDDHTHFTCISRCRRDATDMGRDDSRTDPEETE